MTRAAVLLAPALCALALGPGVSGAGPGVLVNARIHTLDASHPAAQAMAWGADGRVLAIGGRDDVLARAQGLPVYDAKGATVVPGLIDAHAHLMGLGYSLMSADLVGTRSPAEVVARLEAHAATLPPDAWLIGRGWDQNDWPGREFPTAADLDGAFPTRPVWLERVDGHAGWANSAAMRLVRRDLGGDWQPEGGRIVRAGGKVTGVFVDNATGLIDSIVPPPSHEARVEALRRALAVAASAGLTGVHDMGTSLEDLALYRRFADDGRLTMRIVAYADGRRAAFADLCRNGPYRHEGGRLTMPGVKFYADGALGSRGAALLAPYSDDPGNRGLLVTSPDELSSDIRDARRCNLQVATHAIGDRGNRIVLEDYALALSDQARSDHRWRIEHAQVVALTDIPMFAELGVIASMQPTHATSDMPWARDRIGPQRMEGAYAWQRFRQAHVRLALGSDFPVESPDPRLGLYAAVTRQDLEGNPPGGWYPRQRLSRLEALQGFTTDAAWAGFMEHEVGRLAPGMRADFVMLDGDPLTVPLQGLPTMKVLSTWIDGTKVFESASPERARP